MSHTHLIDQILKALRLYKEVVTTRETYKPSSEILKRYLLLKYHDGSFKYVSIIIKIIYLEERTKRNIDFAVYQCARFSSNPKVKHAEAVQWLGR